MLLAAMLLSPLVQPQNVELEEILISGEQPGPAMWKVSKGDHALWIVGTLTPLPAKITWRSRQVEAVVRRSGEVLAGSSVRGDVKGGWFTALRLLPSVMRLRNNADGAKLRQILPPEVHQRWTALHRTYFGKDPDDKESWRPMFAADALYARALQKSGLARREAVWPAIEKLAKDSKVPIRQRTFRVPLPDPKGLIREFAATPRDKDIACLVATLDRIDKDLPNMKLRADAWARGNIATLRSLPYEDQQETCMEAALNGPRLRQLFDEQKANLEADWFGIVSYLLLAHETSLTTLPMNQLLQADGPLARLRAAGYSVEAPE